MTSIVIGGFLVIFSSFFREQSIVAIFSLLEFITLKVSLGCYVFNGSTLSFAVPNKSPPTSQWIMISVSGDFYKKRS